LWPLQLVLLPRGLSLTGEAVLMALLPVQEEPEPLPGLCLMLGMVRLMRCSKLIMLLPGLLKPAACRSCSAAAALAAFAAAFAATFSRRAWLLVFALLLLGGVSELVGDTGRLSAAPVA
jgi:hypothetical protein